MIAIVTLLLVLYLSLFITRIATIALVHTGLSKQVARFQARSALSTCGFTTQESEQMVNHPVRRKILMLLMLFGNVGVVAALSSLVLGFARSGEGYEAWYFKIGLLILGLILLWYVANSQFVDMQLSRVINWALRRCTSLEVKDYVRLFHLANDYRIAEIHVKSDDWVAGKKINETNVRDEGIVLLGIQRITGEYIGAPISTTEIHATDILLVYGKAGLIDDISNRKAGILGDREHRTAAHEQKEIIKAQKERDEKN